MKQGGSREASTGFTMVEVLIVLAVTGLLFISAVVLISGRQNKTEFTTAINGLQQQLQQIINETASGYYPNNGDFTCNGSGTAVTFSTTHSEQGTNSGCIFLGKAIQFGLGSGDAASQLGILPLVGKQYVSGESTATITSAVPRAVYDPGVADASAGDTMQNGLSVASSSAACSGVGPTVSICYATSAGALAQTGIVAFLAGDSSGNITSAADGGVASGSQQLSLYAVNNAAGSGESTANLSVAAAAQRIGNATIPPKSGLISVKSVSICIASATTSQSGLFTIDSGLHVTLSVKSDLTC